MYKSFFGLKERPFQLVPNPKFFFYSSCHKEALAYLNNAIFQGDGFIEISGEVGTGKTVLCRTFIEKMGDKAEIAYIFNPKMDPQHLLQAINEDFGITSDTDNIKDNLDKLNKFLIKKKSENKKIILIIDEAQNLSKEVLEQLRLLSNIETITEKLLQIILVGQPELREKLNSFELRQLGQRITLSWTLYPLNISETREYVLHRIRIASIKSSVVFSKSALKNIYSYSNGCPRLINIVCDRILLTAYSLNIHKISSNVAQIAIKDLKNKGEKNINFFKNSRVTLFLTIFSVLLIFFILFFKYFILTITSIPQNTDAIRILSENKTGDISNLKKIHISQKDSFIDIIKSLNIPDSKSYAIRSTLALWGLDHESMDLNDIDLEKSNFLKEIDKKNTLRSLVINKDKGFELIQNLNLPAIFELSVSKLNPKQFYFVTLYKIKNNTLYFVLGMNKKTQKITLKEIEEFWTGRAFVIWKNHFKIDDYLEYNSTSDHLITLKILLIELGFNNLTINRYFDNDVESSIRQIQKRNNISVDGIVGPRTKIAIYNELERLRSPKLQKIKYKL